jgi:mannan polymerase II complex MNN11 subunit
VQEHIVQWHPTILAKLVLIPQRVMNSYNLDINYSNSNDLDRPKITSGLYTEGDLLVRFRGCGPAPERDCEKEMKSYYEAWESEVQKLDGKQRP